MFFTRVSRNTLSESLEDEIMLLHLFEMQDRNNSSISEPSPWTPSCYSTASKKHSFMTIAEKFYICIKNLANKNACGVLLDIVHGFYPGIFPFKMSHGFKVCI